MSRTYGGALTALNAGTGATTLLAELVGSATKKIRLLRISISGTIATTAEDWDIQLRKYSTASSGGTATTATNTPFDSAFAAATAVFKGFTAAPTAGTLVGTIAAAANPLAVAPAIVQTPLVFNFTQLPAGVRPTLLAATETIGLTGGGVTPGHASSLDIYAWWEELPLTA